MTKFIRNISISAIIFVVLLFFSIAADRLVGAFFGQNAANKGLIFSPQSTFRYETPEFNFTSNINSLGFRDREFELDKRGKTRIITVGDSFTYGWGVESEESWSKLLETRLRQIRSDIEIANLGQPGASPATYAQIVDKAVPLLKPDLVIVCILQGDDLVSSVISSELPTESSRESSSTPVTAAVPIISRIGDFGRRMYPNFLRLLSRRVDQPPLSALWKNQANSIVGELSPEEKAQFDKVDARVRQSFLNGELNPALIQIAVKQPDYFLKTFNINAPEVKSLISEMTRQLIRIKETADKHNSKVIVISVPYKVYASRRDIESSRRLGLNLLSEMAESDSADRAIEAACRDADIEFYEVTGEFRKAANATHLFYEMDGHLNTEGHRVFADLLTPLLERYYPETKTDSPN